MATSHGDAAARTSRRTSVASVITAAKNEEKQLVRRKSQSSRQTRSSHLGYRDTYSHPSPNQDCSLSTFTTVLSQVHSAEGWNEDHYSRIINFYSTRALWHMNGAPRVHDVILKGRDILVLMDNIGDPLFEYCEQMKNYGCYTTKQLEDQYATWFVQILRAFSRAADHNVCFERMSPQNVLFLNLKNQVVIVDFSTSTYLDQLGNKGWMRCKTNMVEDMLCAPEIQRLSSGDQALEEDALVPCMIWLAGATIFQLATGGQSPKYETTHDGHKILKMPASLDQHSKSMKRFFRDVLDSELDYRPRDFLSAIELDWVLRHRKEVVVPTADMLRRKYTEVLDASRGVKARKKSSKASSDRVQRYFKGKSVTSTQLHPPTRRVLCQEKRGLVEGYNELVQTGNLQLYMATGCGWVLTKYEKAILEGTYRGLLPSNVLTRKPMLEQLRRRSMKLAVDPSLTLYSNDYSTNPFDIMEGTRSDLPRLHTKRWVENRMLEGVHGLTDESDDKSTSINKTNTTKATAKSSLPLNSPKQSNLLKRDPR